MPMARPAALIQGYGAQRHAYGEQSARGGILLCLYDGNVGFPEDGPAAWQILKQHKIHRFQGFPIPMGK